MKNRAHQWLALAMILLLAACTKPFDMSGQRLTLGPEWGVVIGSVIVKPVKAVNEAKSPDAADTSYEFDIVQIQPGDLNGESAYAQKYRLVAKGGEERIFISRLPTGRYLLRSFAQERMVGAGGDLSLIFDSMAGEVHYIGRLLIEVPQRVSRGKEYRFAVEDARERTLAEVSYRHAELTKQVVVAPMRTRAEP